MKNGLLKALFVVIGISLALTNVFGQATSHGPVKFDEFGYLNHENYSARLDNIAIALQNEPAAQGYFIFYGGRKSLPGAALRYMMRLQNYMTETRGIEASRMIVLAGGRREDITVEFWISSPGYAAPVPNPAPATEPVPTKSYLYDSYSFDCDPLFQPKSGPSDLSDCVYGGMGYENQSARLHGFAKAISASPGATARLIVTSLTRDSRQKVRKFTQQEKDYLVSKGGLKASNIVLVPRKSRKYRSVELWVVPAATNGAATPKK